MASRSLGTLTIDLVAKTQGFTSGLDKASRSLDSRMRGMQKNAAKVGGIIGAAIGTAAAASVTALATLTSQAIDFADQINDMSQKVGVSTETLSAWGYAAKQSGTDIDALSSSLPKLAKNIAATADETSKQAELFKALGIDTRKGLASVEEILPQIASKFKELNNETQETALAMELFGKSGAELKQFLENGADGLQTMTDRARQLGVVIDSETAQAAGNFNDKLDDLKAVMLGFGLDVAKRLLPALEKTVDQLVLIAKNGDLAANAVTVISAAFNLGVGIINQYNNAVARTSIAIEAVANVLGGATEVAKNFFSFGAAEGTYIGGWKKIATAFDEPQKALDRLIATQKQALTFGDVSAIVTGGGTFKDVNSFSGDKPKVKSPLEEALEKYLAGRDSETKTRSKKVKEELSAEEKAWRKWEEELADVYQGIADASADYEQGLVDQHNRLLDVNASLDEQIKMLGMSAEQQEAYNLAAQAGVTIDSEAGKAIAEKVNQLYEQSEALRDQTEAMDALREAGSDFFVDWISGAKSFKDAALDALDSLNKRILQMIADKLMEQLLGNYGTTGTGSTAGSGWGAAIGQAFASYFGGARAGGGDVFGSRAYLVGEQGPELFVPDSAGTVLSNGDTAGLMTARSRPFNQNVVIKVDGIPTRNSLSQIESATARAGRTAMARNG